MSRISIARIRTVAVAGLMLSVMVLTGCGSQTGPSADKARLDLQDRLTQAYHGLLKVDEFDVAERRVLSEDRVKLHVRGSSKLDTERVAQAKAKSQHSGGLMGMSTYEIRKIRQRAGHEEKATMTYKRSGDNVWQLYRVQQGYQ